MDSDNTTLLNRISELETQLAEANKAGIDQFEISVKAITTLTKARDSAVSRINDSMLQVREDGKTGVQFWHISRVVTFASDCEEWERRG